jgi:hypothetical protein
MPGLELPRRRFLQCLTGIIAAPAVVKADSLMRVFTPKFDPLDIVGFLQDAKPPCNTLTWSAVPDATSYNIYRSEWGPIVPENWRYLMNVAKIDTSSADEPAHAMSNIFTYF